MTFPRAATLGLILLALGMPPLTVACVGSPPGAASIARMNAVDGQAVLAGVPLSNARVVFRDGLYNAVIPTSDVRTDGQGRFMIPRAILNERIATYITVSDGEVAVAGIMTYDGAICRSTGKASASGVVLDTDTSMTAAVLLTNLERLGFTNGEYHAKRGTELPQDLQRQLMDGMAAEAGKRVASALKPGDHTQRSFTAFAFNLFAAPSRLSVKQDGRIRRDPQLDVSDDPRLRPMLQQAVNFGPRLYEFEAPSLAHLLDKGYFRPNASGELDPGSPITQDESAAIFAKVLGVASKNDSVAEAAAKAEQAGLIRNRTATAQEMTNIGAALLVARSLGIEPKDPVTAADLPFTNANEVPETQWGLLAALHERGLLPLNADRTFKPNTVITREGLAEMAVKALRTLPSQDYRDQQANDLRLRVPVNVPPPDPQSTPPILLPTPEPFTLPQSEPLKDRNSEPKPEPKPEPRPVPQPSAATSSAPVASGGGGGGGGSLATPTPTPTPTPADAKVEVTITQGATSPTNEATIN